MQHLGKILGITLFILLYVLVLLGVRKHVIYNELSLELNFGFLIGLIFISFFLCPRIEYVKNTSWIIMLLKLISCFLFINFIVSFFVDLIKRQKGYIHDSYDMTELLVIPIAIVFSIIWGWLLDKVYKKNI